MRSALIDKPMVPGLVSVITPTYNRRDLLKCTAESILSQTYASIEWIVVDDGSSDDTEQAVNDLKQRFGSGNGRTIVFAQQENRGAPAARNHALRLSRGEFIQYLDSDDTLDNDKLALHVSSLMRHPEWEMVYGSSFDMETEAQGRPKGWISPEAFLFESIRSWTIPTNNPLFRRTACQAIGYWDEEMRCFEDATYFGKFFCLGAGYGCLQEAHSWIRGHHVASAGQSTRVSYRGEPSRFKEHALAQARHLLSMRNSFPETMLRERNFRRAFAQEAFRIVRMLGVAGTDDFVGSLMQIHREFSSGCMRSKVEMSSLFLAKMFTGARVGGRIHQWAHERIYEILGGKWRKGT
jgi:glycosyltransferase involved in cell wall biosynthesis